MSNDWYSHTRRGQIAWVRNLLAVVATHEDSMGIPRAHVMQLSADLQAAEAALEKVESENHTPADVARCNMVFDEMETEARYIKRHYLISPPLTLEDLAAIMLPAPDGTHTPIGPPKGQPLVTVTYPAGPHTHLVHFAPVPGTEPLDARGDFGYALYRGIMPQGGATLEQAASARHYLMRVPLDGNELLYFRFLHRSTLTVVFEGSEAGMTACYCSRYENEKGDAGNWGPTALAVIT